MQIKQEALRYLGYNGQKLADSINSLIDECIDEVIDLAQVRHVRKNFELHQGDNCVFIKDCNVILTGTDIKQHLQFSRKAIIMAATLGETLDRKIRYYQYKNMTKATILDACATAYIEEVCNFISAEIAQEAAQQDLQSTLRFSPGYGDLPLSIQPQVLNLLDAQRKIGLTVSEHYLLIPRKSVTAIVGLRPVGVDITEKMTCKNCKTCTNRVCRFRG